MPNINDIIADKERQERHAPTGSGEAPARPAGGNLDEIIRQKELAEKQTIGGRVAATPKLVGQGLAGVAEGALRGTDTVLRDPDRIEGGPLYRAGEAVGEFSRDHLSVLEEYDEGVVSDLTRGVGSMAGFMGTGGAVGLGMRTIGAGQRAQRVGQMGAAVGVAAPAGADEAYQRARAEGLPPEEAQGKARMGLIGGAVQVGNINMLLSRLPLSTRNALVGRIARDSASEAAVEGAGATIQNLIEQSYNPETGTFDGVAYQAAIGAGSAGLVQTGRAGIERAVRGPQSEDGGADMAGVDERIQAELDRIDRLPPEQQEAEAAGAVERILREAGGDPTGTSRDYTGATMAADLAGEAAVPVQQEQGLLMPDDPRPPAPLRSLDAIREEYGAPRQQVRRNVIDQLKAQYGRSAMDAREESQQTPEAPPVRGPAQIMQERGLEPIGRPDAEKEQTGLNRVLDQHRTERQQALERENRIAPYLQAMEALANEPPAVQGVDRNRDDVLTAIAKLGGLNPGELGGEVDVQTMRGVSRVGRPIVRGDGQGLAMDHMAESLSQEGFTAPDGGPLDPNSLVDLVDRASRGERIFAADNDRGSMVDPDNEIAGRWFSGDRDKVANALRKYMAGERLTPNQQGAVDDITMAIEGTDDVLRQRQVEDAAGMDPLQGEQPSWYGELMELGQDEADAFMVQAAEAGLAQEADAGTLEAQDAIEHGDSLAEWEEAAYQGQEASVAGVDKPIVDLMVAAAQSGATAEQIDQAMASGSRFAIIGNLMALNNPEGGANEQESLASIDWQYEQSIGAEPAGPAGQLPLGAYEGSQSSPANRRGSGEVGGPSLDRAVAARREDRSESEPQAGGAQEVAPRNLNQRALVAGQVLSSPLGDSGLSPEQLDAVIDEILVRSTDAVTGWVDARTGAMKSDVDAAFRELVGEGDSVVFASIDIANLGGLNAFHGDVASAANRDFRGIADIIAAEITALGDAFLMRTGGDELGVFVHGVDSGTVMAALDKANEAVKEYANEQGFGDIPHAKGKNMRGVSLHFAADDLRIGLEPGQVYDDVDAQMKAAEGQPDGQEQEQQPAQSPAMDEQQQRAGATPGRTPGEEAPPRQQQLGQEPTTETPAQAGVSASGGQPSRKWKKDGKRIWRSDDGMIITNESMTVGGDSIKSYFVYENAQERDRGNNFASGESYVEAKRLAEQGPPEVEQAEAPVRADSVRDDGSDRTADVAAARGQDDLLGAQQEVAEKVERAASEVDTNPTEAQIEKGNYKKGHVTIQGQDVTLENPRGSTRSGVDPDGNEWSVTMAHHYGYLKRTEGADGEHVDVFIGPDVDSQNVYVIDQVNADGSFDEHKVMLGFKNQKAARDGYRANYQEGWKVGPTTKMAMGDFKAWLSDGDLSKPVKVDHFRGATKKAAKPAKASQEQVVAYGDDSLDLRRRQDKMASIERQLTDEEIASQPLSKLWPKKEIDAIEDVATAAMATALRDSIPSKPRVKSRVNRWVQAVKTMREFMGAYQADPAVAMTEMRKLRTGAPIADRVEVLTQIPRADWGRVTEVEGRPDAYRFDKDGNQESSPYVLVRVDGRREIISGKGTVAEAMPDILQLLGQKQEQAKAIPMEIRYTTEFRAGQAVQIFFINKKGDPAKRALKTFESSDAARDYLRNNRADLEAEWERVKERDNVKKTDMRRKENRERVGMDHRNGKDVTVEEFHSKFGLRHVDWGKWVSDKSGERQNILNRAYDAFMDLANITGLPPAAIGLNGDLIITFGKRGSGRFSAHFEPGQTIINLTKTKGAGSLAHEWFHALDNYFQKQHGAATNRGDFITYNPEPYYLHSDGSSRVSADKFEAFVESQEKGTPNRSGVFIRDPSSWKKVDGVRPEVLDKFAKLVKALDASPMRKRAAAIDSGKADGYWSRIIERAARSFENYAIAKMQESGEHNDFLANVVDVNKFVRNPERYPYLLESEMAPVQDAFDALFQTIETRQTDSGTAMFSQAERGPVRTVWQPGFPKAIISLGSQDFQKHSDYRAAKNGDIAAAVRLAKDSLKQGDMVRIKRLAKGVKGKPVLVPVHAEEEVSVNRIPLAASAHVGKELGWDVDASIVQIEKIGRSGGDGFYRLTNQPRFIGEVEPGRSYVLLDDTLTQGGTFAALKGYIDSNGGEVIGVVAMEGKQYSSQLAPTGDTLETLRKRWPELEGWWNEQFGYGFDQFTESEARYLARVRVPSIDALRDRVLAARQARVPGGSPPPTGRNGPLTSAAQSPEARPSAGLSVSALRKTLRDAVGQRLADSIEVVQSVSNLPLNPNLKSLSSQQVSAAVELNDEGDIGKVETGKPVSFWYRHNTQSATDIWGMPREGDQFSRDKEPSGRYMTIGDKESVSSLAGEAGWETGRITLLNPLVVDVDGWKPALSERYSGKTGKRLSQALIKDGYDGVITVDRGGRHHYISEVLDLQSFDASKARYSTNNRVEGLFDPASGKVYLVADNLPNADRAAWVAWHELWHRGIRSVDGEARKQPGTQEGQALRQALNLAGLNKSVKQLADAIMRDRGMSEPDRRIATEEALAELNAADEIGDYQAIQNRYGVTVPQGMRAGIRGHIARFLESAKRVLSGLFGRSSESISDGEVWRIIAGAREGYVSQAFPNPVEDSPMFSLSADQDSGGDPIGYAGGPRVDSGLKRLAQLRGWFESAADLMDRTPGLSHVGEAVRLYYDRIQANRGAVKAPELRAVDELKALSRKERDQTMADFEAHRAAVENGRDAEARQILEGGNDTLRTMVDAWQEMADVTGDMSREVGVMVQDANTGEYRPMGKVKRFWPRQFREDIQKALDAPHKHPETWNRMVESIMATGKFDNAQDAGNYLTQYANEASQTVTENDFFAGIEKGRTEPLPEMFYDYSWNAGLLYKEAWAERLAQIQAFGQSYGVGANKVQDLFERTLDGVRDANTRDYLQQVAGRVYNQKYEEPHIRMMQTLNAVATGIQLGNPATALLNVIGGTGLNFQAYGVRNSAKVLALELNTWPKLKQQMRIAKEMGILQDDYLQIMHDSERTGVPKGLRSMVSGMLRYGGYTPMEHFIRTHAMVAGKSYLRDALRVWNEAPGSQKAARYARWFRENKFDIQRLIDEAGEGEYTDRFVRYSVNLTQGSYKVDQTPVFVDTPVGRFIWKYQKFGTQLTRMFWRNHLKPFVDTVTGNNKETYTIDGQEYSARLYHFMPMLRFFAVGAGAGMLLMDWREELFGYQNRAPTLGMIDRALQDDEKAEALAYSMERAFQGFMAVGGVGFITNYYQMAMDVADRQRVKSPLDPPALSPVVSVTTLVMDGIDQGGMTWRRFDSFLQESLSVYRTAKRATANTLGSQLPFRELQVQAAKSDVAFVKKMGRRYAAEAGLTAKRRSAGRYAPTANTSFNTHIADALMIGDVARAREMVRDHFGDRSRFPTPQERRNALLSLKSSVRARDPARIGIAPSERERQMFLRWARDNTSPAEYARIMRVSQEYRQAAARAGLL